MKKLMDSDTGLAYHQLVEERAPQDLPVPLDTLSGWLKDLKILLKSFGRCGGMGRNSANTTGFIS